MKAMQHGASSAPGENSPISATGADMSGDVDELVAGGMSVMQPGCR